jgi:hypothetical protein
MKTTCIKITLCLETNALEVRCMETLSITASSSRILQFSSLFNNATTIIQPSICARTCAIVPLHFFRVSSSTISAIHSFITGSHGGDYWISARSAGASSPTSANSLYILFRAMALTRALVYIVKSIFLDRIFM